MMENGFSSPRNDTFPAGLRVLVVDDDPTWLKILEKMLKKCSYEVTTRGLARDALSLLRERRDGYDIVISDVNMPDMDGFKLLEHVGLEMDLPVIMMSVDGETSRVMKGVQHGACDYLLKPIRMKELRNIWQHVFRKKIHEIRDIESHESFEAIYMMKNGSDHSDDGHLLSMEDLTSVKKRKDIENKHDDKDFGDASSTKKSRVVWSVDLHQKFVKAVNQIGFDKVGPKKILDLMNVPWLTRENVASHLQKYRLYLSRLQKEKESDLKSSFGGMKHSDVSPNDPSGSFALQNSVNTHQNDVVNGSYGFSVSNLLVQNVDPNNKHEGESLVSEPTAETKRASTSHLPDPHKTKNSQMVFNHSFASLESEVNLTAFDSTIPTNYSWSEVPEMEFKQEHKPLIPLENGFSKLPVLDPPHHIHVDQLQSISSVTSKPSSVDRGITGPINIKPPKGEYGSSQVNCVTSTASTSDSFQTKSNMENHQALEPIYSSTCSMKAQGFNQSSIIDLESTQRKQTLGNGSPFVSFDDDLQVLFQGDCYGMNIGLHNVEFPEYNAQGLIDEVPFHLYDSLRPGYEYPCDTTEYSVIDQRLFIA